jgi:hypothetical protein
MRGIARKGGFPCPARVFVQVPVSPNGGGEARLLAVIFGFFAYGVAPRAAGV